MYLRTTTSGGRRSFRIGSNICIFAPSILRLGPVEARNIQRDRDDVKYFANAVPLDLEVTKERYQKDLRWQLGNPEREDLTLRLWIEAIEEGRRSS